MSSVKEMRDKIKFLNENKEQFAVNTLTDSDIDIMQDRLEEGRRADGDFYPDYSPYTLGVKRVTGGFVSSTGAIAWKDTGGFYDSMKLRKYKGFAEIDSDDSVASSIFEKAPDVLDVSQEESNEMFNNHREEMIEDINKFLF